MCITLESAIQLLGLYPKETREDVPKNVCAGMFISALVTIAKKWKRLHGPSGENWLNRLWFIHIMESYTAIKTDGVHLCRWHQKSLVIRQMFKRYKISRRVCFVCVEFYIYVCTQVRDGV